MYGITDESQLIDIETIRNGCGRKTLVIRSHKNKSAILKMSSS